MKSLRQEDKDLVLDYFFSCGTDVHLNGAKQLIDTDPRAMELYNKLSDTLKHLDHVDHDEHAECPDHLIEITLSKLKVVAAENTRLESLLAAEGEKVLAHKPNINISRFRSFWHNIPDVATVAAILMIVASIAFPTLNNMRNKACQIACSAGLSRVGQGISRYGNDNNGDLPAVATVLGDPWWKVGDQGKANQSNTRHPWELVKNGYVEATDFVCGGRKNAISVKFTKGQLKELNDFPSREHISYSYMFMCDKRAKHQWSGGTVLMADLNPIFEGVSASTTKEEFEKLSLSEKLQKAMSTNHRNGQVVLFYDGSAVYKRIRIISGDDIYTTKDKNAYTGCEAPQDIKDIFLVP